jgi:hypothetical protein
MSKRRAVDESANDQGLHQQRVGKTERLPGPAFATPPEGEGCAFDLVRMLGANPRWTGSERAARGPPASRRKGRMAKRCAEVVALAAWRSLAYVKALRAALACVMRKRVPPPPLLACAAPKAPHGLPRGAGSTGRRRTAPWGGARGERRLSCTGLTAGACGVRPSRTVAALTRRPRTLSCTPRPVSVMVRRGGGTAGSRPWSWDWQSKRRRGP